MINKYLSLENTLARLVQEYLEHGQIVVAFDFDDTVCTYTKGNPEPTLARKANEEVCQLIRDLRPYAKLVLWTCRSNRERIDGEPDTPLNLAELWLQNHRVPYDTVNQNTVVDYGSPKIYANAFLDDRAGLAASYMVLKEFLNVVRAINQFDASVARATIVSEIRHYFHKNGGDRAIIGISGGTDSTVVAALCVEALGPEKVLGVLMPNGRQKDMEDATEVCGILGIQYVVVNIESQVNQMLYDLGFNPKASKCIPDILKNNLPALVRRNVLTSIALVHGGRVMNTTNATENMLGYITKGDNIAGDFAPLLNYMKTEVIAIGFEYDNIPSRLITKPPSDGMCGNTDEERFGFTYKEADAYIKGADRFLSEQTQKKITQMILNSDFKRQPLATAPRPKTILNTK